METLLCAAVGTASRQHGLEACTVCGRTCDMLKSNHFGYIGQNEINLTEIVHEIRRYMNLVHDTELSGFATQLLTTRSGLFHGFGIV